MGREKDETFLSPLPHPLPLHSFFLLWSNFSTQTMLDGELDRDRFKGSELKPGQSSHRYSRKKDVTGYIFSVEHTTCDYHSQTNKNSKA